MKKRKCVRQKNDLKKRLKGERNKKRKQHGERAVRVKLSYWSSVLS